MINQYVFSARKTLVKENTWVWIPYLFSSSGKNFWWPTKQFRTKIEATNYPKEILHLLEKEYF